MAWGRGLLAWALVAAAACGRLGFEAAPAAGDGGGADDGGGGDGSAAGCALPAPFDLGAVYERTLYVSPDGDDSADGSAAAPLATPEEAAIRATPGTRVEIAAGTYSQQTLRARGERDRPIAFVAAGEVRFAGILLESPEFLVLEGFQIENSAVHGLHANRGLEGPLGRGVVLRRLAIRNAGGNCVRLFFVDEVHLLDSELFTCGSHGVVVRSVNEAVVARNRIQAAGRSGARVDGGSRDVLIQGNRFDDWKEYGIEHGGLPADEIRDPADSQALRVIVTANVFASGVGTASFRFDGSRETTAANNTIFRPTGLFAAIDQTSPGSGVEARDGLLVNNLIAFRTDELDLALVRVQGETHPASYIFGSNLWWAIDDPDFPGPSYPAPIAPETGAVVGMDPELVDPGSDHRVSASSPAVGAGRPVAELGADFDGTCYQEPPTIGAHEPR